MTFPLKILITGSSGYVGNFLAVHFAQSGMRVVGLDIKQHNAVSNVPNFSFRHCDVRDYKSLLAIFKEEAPTHIIHLAYLMDPIHDREYEYAVDVEGSQHVLEAALATSSIKQFVLFSSTSAYGAHPDNPEWLNEDAPLRPGNYNYAVYKKAIEESYSKQADHSNFKLVILRMCTAVGPSYYKPGGIVSSFTKSPIALQSGSELYRMQFIHEDDVKSLMDYIVNDSSIEGTYNLCPNSYAYLYELAQAQNKRVLNVPLWLLKSIFGLLWHLRIAPVTPAIAKLMAFSIVARSQKIIDRYKYNFQYTTREAFIDAVNKRRANGTL